MSPPKGIPGFYYDSEKNRYFPIKGPIPGSNKCPKLDPCSSSNKEDKVQSIKMGKRIKASKLISLREIQGRDIFSNSKRCFFRDQFEKLQASQPVVWKYETNKPLAGSAMELVNGTMQSLNGSRDAVFLATGATAGQISLFEMRNSFEDSNVEYRHTNISSKPIWPQIGESIQALNWRLNLMKHHINLKSEISCIKFSPQRTQKRALVTTLGSGGVRSLVGIVDLNQLGSVSIGINVVVYLDSTIWTADLNPDGSHAILGTSNGSTLLNVETKSSTKICGGKSDVLSQQFACSGNVVLCGLRNGSIHAIDIRENPQSRSDRRDFNRRNEIKKQQNSSNSVRMSSAVCSLASLVLHENYFLGSSMDGSIKLFDLRALKNGSVQSYEGHVNSHTRIQLAVNPSETLFLSGGQDCGVRIWSIKSGELIFSENFSDSIFTTACWPDLKDRFNVDKSCGAWLGSRSSLSYMHGI